MQKIKFLNLVNVNKVLTWLVYVLIVVRLFTAVMSKNYELATWVLLTGVWLIMFQVERHFSDKWKTLATESLEGWGKGIEAMEKSVLPLIEEVDRLRKEVEVAEKGITRE